MSGSTRGIHHITAIAGDPQRNLDFYSGVLGSRLVKRTVNFDDPTTYHLYYGDERGRPGTILTFFPWAGVPRGSISQGQTSATSFAIPADSLEYWEDRLARHAIDYRGPSPRFGNGVLTFADPDGLRLELCALPEASDQPGWGGGPVDSRHSIRGFHAATLTLGSHERTAAVLSEVLGFREVGIEGDRRRYETEAGGLASRVDLVSAPGSPRGRMGAGTVHHIAWRAADDLEQQTLRGRAIQHGLDPTEVLDRQYFRSVYFREPGGVLFEIATDAPGFDVDESVEELGTHLELPPWLERMRAKIEQALPPLHVAARGSAS